MKLIKEYRSDSFWPTKFDLATALRIAEEEGCVVRVTGRCNRYEEFEIENAFSVQMGLDRLEQLQKDEANYHKR